MTKVEIELGQDKSIRKISVHGHANYEESGSDIVCAGISTLLMTGALAVREIVGKDIMKECKDGKLVLEVPTDSVDDKMQVILQTVIIGLRDIESGYPKNIKIKEI